MKKLFCLVMVVMMTVACFVGCAAPQESAPATSESKPAEAAPAASDAAPADAAPAGGEIVVGMIGPYTGDTAVYGLAVKNGATLFIDQVNANGGVNGKTIKVVSYDNKGDDSEAVTAFNRLVDQDGITALIGDVLTSNTIAVVGEAYPINMPMITASATAAAVTVNEADGSIFTNVFRTCFIDPFQGEKMAAYAFEKLGYTTAGILYNTSSDYSKGLADSFKAKFTELGGTVVSEAGYAEGDVDFNSQLTNMAAQNPECVFCPNYYQDLGMIITQARKVGMTAKFLGGDGFPGTVDYASAEDLEGSMFCSGYAPGSTEAVQKFEADYEAAYGEKVPNMFAALAYDAAKVLVAALEKAEATGTEPGSDEYKQAVIDGIKSEGPAVVGVTSETGFSFDEFNNPRKAAVIMEVVGGVETFKEMF